MKLTDLEHIIRAASAITDQHEIIIFGSQAILGTVTNGPKGLYFSEEADVHVPGSQRLIDLIDGCLGEQSSFHETFGYYAQGISDKVVVLAPGWEERLVKIQNQNTDLKVGFCLSANDLAFSKICAFREKDKEFVKVLFEHNYADPNWVKDQVESHPRIDQAKCSVIVGWLDPFLDAHRE